MKFYLGPVSVIDLIARNFELKMEAYSLTL